MQLPLSADVLVPVGVGVLVAVVAVILLVFGLRQRAEDASVPTDADWTSEHVGEVATPPTRTVADAVAARQGNTGPFVVVAPKQPGAGQGNGHADGTGTEKRNGNGRGSRGAAALSSLGPVVSASVVARSRGAVQASARGAGVAMAEPGGTAAAERAAGPEPGAVEGSATDTGLRAQAGHASSGDDADRPPFPADPLFGAGRFDQVGPDGDPWFTPPAMPRTQLGGPGRPAGPEAEPSAASDGPTPADPDLPLPDRTTGTAGQAVDPRPAAAPPATAPQTAATARADHPARGHADADGPQGVPRPPAPVDPAVNAPEPVQAAPGLVQVLGGERGEIGRGGAGRRVPVVGDGRHAGHPGLDLGEMIDQVVGDPADRLVRGVDPVVDRAGHAVPGRPGRGPGQHLIHQRRHHGGRIQLITHAGQ